MPVSLLAADERSSSSPHKLSTTIECISTVEQCAVHNQPPEHCCCRCQSACCGRCSSQLIGIHTSHNGEVRSVAQVARTYRAQFWTLIQQCLVHLRSVQMEWAALRRDESALSLSL